MGKSEMTNPNERTCRFCNKTFSGKPFEMVCPECMILYGRPPETMIPTEEQKEPGFFKADNGKLEWDLMPFEQLEPVVKILMFGAKKYRKDNWKYCDDIARYKNAAMRHLVAYMKGEKIDPESNENHMAHLICNALFLMYFDDKTKEGAENERN